MEKVYIQDDGEKLKVINIENNKELYSFTYRQGDQLLWNYDDSYRRLRKIHLASDYFQEVFKCECGKYLEIPERFNAFRDELNRIKYILECECGRKIIIKCDTLMAEKGEK